MNLKPGSGYRMGLAPESLTHWLPQVANGAEVERKVGLMRLSRLPEPVYQSLPGSEAAERRAASFVMTHLAQHQQKESSTASRLHPNPSMPVPPLSAAALRIPDDLCVMRLDAQTKQFFLVAASVCSPSYWALSEKLGLSLTAIHEPVPGLNPQLGDRMQALFLQLPQQRCFVRRNFFVHAQQDLYQPSPDETDYRQLSCAALMLRSERQSLVRISTDLVLFSIRVDLAPLADARHWPAEAGALRRVLKGLSSRQREAFGSAEKLEAVLGFLAQFAAVDH